MATLRRSRGKSRAGRLFGLDIVTMLMVIIVAAVIVGLVLYSISIFNRLFSLKNSAEATLGQIGVALKKRLDLITQLVESVRAYVKFERETLERIAKLRSEMFQPRIQDLQGVERESRAVLNAVLAVAESYPDLKANQNFLQLQDELTHTEDKISYSRQHFNDSVLQFNNLIETFPGNIFANMMGKKTREMLQIPEASREVPKVSF